MTSSRIDFSALDFLVIEENSSSHDTTGDMLRSFGVKRLREARTIEAAMRDIERRAPDVILCDWMSKPTNGLSFLRKLKCDPAKPYAKALVIMINEQSSSDHIQAALGEGADSYIVKPFQPATLLDHLVKAATAKKMRPVA